MRRRMPMYSERHPALRHIGCEAGRRLSVVEMCIG